MSFERYSRILEYGLDLEHLASRPKNFRPAIKKVKLPKNSGLEAITTLEPPGSVKLSKVDIVVFSENSTDKRGNIRGFISTKKKWREFTVRAIDDFKITDATLLPGGHLLLLERMFSITNGAAIQMRIVPASSIKPGAVIDGKIIFNADNRFQIDNLEGVSAWVNENNQIILTIVSDNNFSFLQRNLMLEFELLPDQI